MAPTLLLLFIIFSTLLTVVSFAKLNATSTRPPSKKPTAQPSIAPSASPTTAVVIADPIIASTPGPTTAPTAGPTAAPTDVPTATPTVMPTPGPTVAPTFKPTIIPTAAPTAVPTFEPSVMPTAAPTVVPTATPTVMPTAGPTVMPTFVPSTALPSATLSPTSNTLWQSNALISNLNRKALQWGNYSVLNSEMTLIYLNNSCAANTGNKGGVGFYSYPLGTTGVSVFPQTEISFQYDIYFDPNFNWVKGGKLPGLYGGVTGASGGNHIDNGMSTRIMWRRNGGGELYMYMPLAQDATTTAIAIDETPYGLSLGRNSFYFVKGQWQTIKVYMKMNDIGVNNGILELSYNGVVKISLTKVNLRTQDIPVNGIMFQSFFGGSDMTWKSALDTYIKFRNMYLTVR